MVVSVVTVVLVGGQWCAVVVAIELLVEIAARLMVLVCVGCGGTTARQ